MISAQQYQIALGSFLTVATKIEACHQMGKTLTYENLYDLFDHLQHYYSLCIHHALLAMSGVYEEIIYCYIKLKLLLLNNDIEVNTGPSFFEKQIHGSFHQGHTKFGTSAGKQCAVIALFSLCFSVRKSINLWSDENLDAMLEYGNELFNSLNIDRFLEPRDLPKNVNICSLEVNQKFTFFHQAFLENCSSSKSFWINLLEQHFGQHTLFWLGQNAVALIKSKYNKIYLFDSHSRDSHGRISDSGKSILMTFASYNNLLNYVLQTYVAQTNEKKLLSQIQFLTCYTSATALQCTYALKKFRSSFFIDAKNSKSKRKQLEQKLSDAGPAKKRDKKWNYHYKRKTCLQNNKITNVLNNLETKYKARSLLHLYSLPSYHV